jgi:hypothetical protein
VRIALALLLVATLLTASRIAGADPIRVLVSVSHARGIDGEQPLNHTSEDADQVRDVLTSLGGVAPENAIRLVDPTAAALQGALDRARDIAAKHPASDVIFVLYFSGHGDRDRIHLGAETVPLATLTERVRAVPAALRILVTDACRNDALHPKGIVTEPAFALAGQGSASEGVVWLSASGTGEAAQESDVLKGALFTHYWVSGLRGAADANGDGRVTLTESYDFAYSQTLYAAARGSGVLQHPTATLALSELSPVVLTQTFGNATRLEVPASADTHYLVYSVGSRTVFGELWSNPDHAAVIAVPPGRYVVHRRGSGATPGAVEIALSRGDDHVIAPADFHPVPEEQLAAKGGAVVLRPNELTLDLGAGTTRVADIETTAEVQWAHVMGEWAIAVGPRGAFGYQRTSASYVHVETVGLEATVERRWRLGTPTLAIGIGGATDVVWQRVERVDAARVAAVGYATTSNFTAWAAGPIAVARLRYPLGTASWLQAALGGELLWAEFDTSPAPLWAATASLGAGVSF